MSNAVLATISSGPSRPLVETADDPNLAILRWLWRIGPDPFWTGTKTYACAAPFRSRLVRLASPVVFYGGPP